MTYNDEGLPCVDLHDCATPREVLRRVEAFIDELSSDTLRKYASVLVLEDR
jgi:hypothetical protein